MTPKIGGKTLVRIIMRNELLDRSPVKFLELSPEAMVEEYRLPIAVAQDLHANAEVRMAATLAMEKRLAGVGVTWVTSAEAHYPSKIEAMDPNPPGVLFLYGNVRLLEANTFSVLSSRHTRPAELDHIERLTEEGVLNGEVLVTGQNTPAYQRSAVVPLRWGAPRILCVDRGLFRALGPELKHEGFSAARLWRHEFDPETDLVASPFRPDDPFIGVNNRTRDYLIGCLSTRLAFVSASPGGNMEKIAKAALKVGKKVAVSDTILEYRQFRDLGAEIFSDTPTPR